MNFVGMGVSKPTTLEEDIVTTVGHPPGFAIADMGRSLKG